MTEPAAILRAAPAGQLASEDGVAATAPLDAESVGAALRAAAATLAGGRATGAELAEATRVMDLVRHIPHPEDRRLVRAWAAGHPPREIATAAEMCAEGVYRRLEGAIGAIVAALAEANRRGSGVL